MNFSTLETTLASIDAHIGGVVIAEAPMYPFMGIRDMKARFEDDDRLAVAAMVMMWHKHERRIKDPVKYANSPKLQNHQINTIGAYANILISGGELPEGEFRKAARLGYQFSRHTLEALREWAMENDANLARHASLFSL